MKKIITILTIPMLFLACGGNLENPKDLKGKKALLTKKQTALETLQREIAQLEKEILKLDPPKEKPRKLVTTLVAEQKDFNHFIEIQGSVTSDEYVTASAEIGGRILKMPLQEGQNVKTGQLVATLDVEQVNKQIAELEKSLELANDVFARQERLWKQNIGSELQFLQAKNNKERLEKSLETVKFQLTKANVYAPKSGVVEMVNLKAGELAGPGVPIVQILNTNKVKVVASVPETYLTSVKRGDLVTVKFPALDLEKQAKISRIGTTVNPANRTFDVEIDLQNPKGIFKPNLLANMLINDKTREDVVMIPVDLLQNEVDGTKYILVTNQTNEGLIAQKRVIETSDSFEGEIIVEKGLVKGDTLIAEGARGLKDGALIRVD